MEALPSSPWVLAWGAGEALALALATGHRVRPRVSKREPLQPFWAGAPLHKYVSPFFHTLASASCWLILCFSEACRCDGIYSSLGEVTQVQATWKCFGNVENCTGTSYFLCFQQSTSDFRVLARVRGTWDPSNPTDWKCEAQGNEVIFPRPHGAVRPKLESWQAANDSLSIQCVTLLHSLLMLIPFHTAT